MILIYLFFPVLGLLQRVPGTSQLPEALAAVERNPHHSAELFCIFETQKLAVVAFVHQSEASSGSDKAGREVDSERG